MTLIIFLIRILGRISSFLPPRARARIKLLQQQHLQPVEAELLELPGILARFQVPMELAVDAGANHGLWTTALAKLFKEVIAIEANPDLARGLTLIVPPNCRVIGEGLSRAPGTLEFFIPAVEGKTLDGWSSFDKANCPGAQSWTSFFVPVTTLDSLLGNKPPSFVKMDIEGYEYMALMGAERALCTARPIMMIEVRGEHRALVIEQLSLWGYVPKRLDELTGKTGSPANLFFIPTEHL